MSRPPRSASVPSLARLKILVSPLMLADQLLTMAEQADRSGLRPAAAELVRLAHDVCDLPRRA